MKVKVLSFLIILLTLTSALTFADSVPMSESEFNSKYENMQNSSWTELPNPDDFKLSDKSLNESINDFNAKIEYGKYLLEYYFFGNLFYIALFFVVILVIASIIFKLLKSKGKQSRALGAAVSITILFLLYYFVYPLFATNV